MRSSLHLPTSPAAAGQLRSPGWQVFWDGGRGPDGVGGVRRSVAPVRGRASSGTRSAWGDSDRRSGGWCTDYGVRLAARVCVRPYLAHPGARRDASQMRRGAAIWPPRMAGLYTPSTFRPDRGSGPRPRGLSRRPDHAETPGPVHRCLWRGEGDGGSSRPLLRKRVETATLDAKMRVGLRSLVQLCEFVRPGVLAGDVCCGAIVAKQPHLSGQSCQTGITQTSACSVRK